MDIINLQTIIITSGNPRVKRDEFYILLGLSISQGIIQCSTLCSVACIKTNNILFHSQVFEVDYSGFLSMKQLGVSPLPP